ncbi:MAG: helix-turn-helix transcriptional regulator [Fusobacteriales bacterium]|jgi:AraC-like DNA-binding protein|nr:helix-turn-helix transcriptional regulator [Fusobacteriales bacterium]
MNYKEFLPGKNLRHIIDSYWFLESFSVYGESQVFPDCSMDIIFNFGNCFRSKSNSKSVVNNNDIIITGMMTGFKNHFMEKNSRLFGVRFKPLGLNRFLNFEFNNIKNDIIDLNSVISGSCHQKFRNIFLLTEYKDIIAFFEKIFIENLNFRSNDIDLDVSLAIQSIYNSENPSVNELHKITGISQRYLEIKFKKEIGINMKEFINIERFIKTKKEILCSDKSLSEIAVNNGYYDSSHMIKDFIKYTGSSPKNWK